MRFQLNGTPKGLQMLGNIYKLINNIGMLLFKAMCNFIHRSKVISKGVDRDLYRTRFGHLFWLNTMSYVDQCIIRNGIFEDKSTEAINLLVKPGDIVLDIGANIGYYSVLLSNLVGKNGKVICFEPTKYFRTVLKRNVEENNLNNVEIVNIGLSNKRQTLNIHISESTATLHSPGGESPQNSECINLVPLDEFIIEHNLPRIDFIKIDIDGHEPLFFEGAWSTIDKFDPIILLEISHSHYLEAGYTAWDFYEMLKRKQYKIYHEDKLTKITSKQDFLSKCGNFAYSSNIIISRKELYK